MKRNVRTRNHSKTKRKSHLMRLLSFVLVLALCVQSMLIQVNAASVPDAQVVNQSGADGADSGLAAHAESRTSDPDAKVTILGEVEELREEGVKHFRLSDGNYMAVSYGMPVHYRDAENTWQDIDNRLIPDTKTDSFTAGRPYGELNFASSLEEGKLFSIAEGDTVLSMSLLDTSLSLQMQSALLQSQELKSSQTETSLSFNRLATATLTQDSPPITLEDIYGGSIYGNHQDIMPDTLQSSLVYEDAFPDVDLVYTAVGYNIKEQIVVNSPQTSYRYDFLLKLTGLLVKMHADGSISLYTLDKEKKYYIPAPYMVDASGEISYDVRYHLAETNQGIILTVEADKEWLNQAGRSFPVKIDPTVTTSPPAGDITATYVYEGNPTSTFFAEDRLNVGVINGWRYRTLMRVNCLPQIAAGAEVVDAYLSLYQMGHVNYGETQAPVALYEGSQIFSTEYDDYNAISWEEMPSYDMKHVIDYQTALESSGYLSWTLTDVVRKWYREEGDHLLCLAMMNEEEKNALTAFSSPFVSTPPVISVVYRNSTGIEDYYTYQPLGAGSAGTAYLCDFTGQLKVANTLFSYASVSNPFALELVYNSDYFKTAGTDYQPPAGLGMPFGLGSGWTMNIIQKVEEVTISGVTCLKYRDGDGTDHYFYQNTETGESTETGETVADTAYYDEDGLGLKIEKTITDTGALIYTMTDKGGNTKVFENSFLRLLTDSDGNSLEVLYSSSLQVTGITLKNKDLASLPVCSLTYEDTRLASAQDAAGNTYVPGYSEDGSLLTSLTMQYTQNGTVASKVLAEYTYENRRLTSMKDVESDYSLHFEYTNGKLSRYYEMSGGVIGVDVGVTYDDGGRTTYRKIHTHTGSPESGGGCYGTLTTQSVSCGTFVEYETATQCWDEVCINAYGEAYEGAGFCWVGSGAHSPGGYYEDHDYETSYAIECSNCGVSGGANGETHYIIADVYVPDCEIAQAASAYDYIHTHTGSPESGGGCYGTLTTQSVSCGTFVEYETATQCWDEVCINAYGEAYEGAGFCWVGSGAHSPGGYYEDHDYETYYDIKCNSCDAGGGANGETHYISVNVYELDCGLEETSFQGSTNYTAIGTATHYLFDYWGRTVNIYSTDVTGTKILGATNAAYIQQAGDDTNQLHKAKNRIAKTASMGMAAKTFNHNGSMEDLTVKPWAPQGGGTVVNEPAKARTGNHVLKGSLTGGDSYAAAYQLSEALTEGETYTFSAYVNTAEITAAEDMEVYLKVSYGEQEWFSNRIDYATGSAINGGWVPLAVTFTAPEDGVYTLIIHGQGAEGIYYADDAQLEEAKAPSNFNLLLNGNMQTAGYGWTGSVQTSYVSGTEMDSPDSTAASMRILGDYAAGADAAAYQDVALNLPGTQSYVLSGWAKGNAVPDNLQTAATPEEDLNKQFGLRAQLTYTDGTEEYHYGAFNPDISDWQFVSTAIVPKEPAKTVASVRVTCAYEGNANTAYFDDISLVREKAQTYEYDEEGNLTSVTTTDLEEETYTYDGESNLIKLITGGSGTFDYTYDTTYKHRLTSVTNGQITQSMTYDGVGNNTSVKLQSSDGSLYVESTALYTADGNRIQSVTDAAGNTTAYDFGSGNTLMWGLHTGITTPDGVETSYEYDATGRLTKTSLVDTASLQYTYTTGRITSLQRTANRSGTNVNQTYTLSYDAFGNMTGVLAGNHTLASYEYDERHLQTRQTYGNGQAITYTYDELERLKTETYPDGRVVTYRYNGDGNLFSVQETGGDSPGGDTYDYDSLGRLISMHKWDREGNLGTNLWSYTQDYDRNNRVSFQGWTFPGSAAYTSTYTYNDNGTLQGMTTGGMGLSYSYDALLRLSGVTSQTVPAVSKTYAYRNLTQDQTQNRTTMQVKELAYPNLGDGYSFHYTYDMMGNIASYASDDEELISYTYDNQGQLTAATGENTSYAYTYDGAGNLLTAIKGGTPHTYTYGDSTWADLLTAYDGEAITYDAMGNPFSYYNGTRWTFTWGNGRRLETATDGTDSISYNYTADGTRTGKTVNGVVHTYYYSGTTLLRETYGDTVLDFFYDSNGLPFALKQNGTTYYYITNLQGDVIRLVDGSGNTVASYTYDPYGNPITAAGALAEVNPLRYRGYYYDTETGLYYIAARYYDSQVGRFISADAVSMLGANGDFASINLFAYCGNNPISRRDVGGYAWETVFDVVSLGVSIADVVANPTNPWAWAGLAGDVVDVAVPFVGGIGEAIDVARAASAAAEVADTVYDAGKVADNVGNVTDIAKVATTGTPNAIGKIGEQLAGIDSGAKVPIEVGGRIRIPDAMTHTTLTEVKNVKYLSNTSQLRDFATFANQTERTLNLYVRPSTKISRTVIDAGWNIRYLW